MVSRKLVLGEGAGAPESNGNLRLPCRSTTPSPPNLRLVSGHDLQSCRKGLKIEWASAPEGLVMSEKLAHLQHEEWLAKRPKASEAGIARAVEILNRDTGVAPAEEDRLPEQYQRNRRA